MVCCLHVLIAATQHPAVYQELDMRPVSIRADTVGHAGVAHGSPDASLTKTTPMSSLRPSGTLAAATDDAGHLLALLAERDAELATLEAELAVARAALAGNTGRLHACMTS